VLPLPISALRAAAPVLTNPANRHRAIPLTYDQFRYAFANAVSEDEAHELYARPFPHHLPRLAGGRPDIAGAHRTVRRALTPAGMHHVRPIWGIRWNATESGRSDGPAAGCCGASIGGAPPRTREPQDAGTD
jgi:hypothetical protein